MKLFWYCYIETVTTALHSNGSVEQRRTPFAVRRVCAILWCRLPHECSAAFSPLRRYARAQFGRHRSRRRHLEEALEPLVARACGAMVKMAMG